MGDVEAKAIGLLAKTLNYGFTDISPVDPELSAQSKIDRLLSPVGDRSQHSTEMPIGLLLINFTLLEYE